MKMHMELDFTPEEARRFLGLPDVAPMQEAVMARLQQQMLDNMAAAAPEALMRAWIPLAPMTPDQLRDSFQRFIGMFGGSTPKKD